MSYLFQCNALEIINVPSQKIAVTATQQKRDRPYIYTPKESRMPPGTTASPSQEPRPQGATTSYYLLTIPTP